MGAEGAVRGVLYHTLWVHGVFHLWFGYRNHGFQESLPCLKRVVEVSAKQEAQVKGVLLGASWRQNENQESKQEAGL